MAAQNPNLPQNFNDILMQLSKNPKGLANLEEFLDKKASPLSMPKEVSDNHARVDDISTTNAENLAIREDDLMESQRAALRGVVREFELKTSSMPIYSTMFADKPATSGKKSRKSTPISVRMLVDPYSFNLGKGLTMSATSHDKSVSQAEKSLTSDEDQLLEE